MITTFLYLLAGGMLVVVATGRMKQIAWGFLRLIGLVAFALLCGITVWIAAQGDGSSAAGASWTFRLGAASTAGAIGVVFMAPFAARYAGIFRMLCAAAGMLGIAAGCLSSMATVANGMETPPASRIVMIATQLLGGYLLGSITIAWLLGHAYLTATRMTIDPLRHFSRMLLWAVALRLLFAVSSLALASIVQRRPDMSVLAELSNAWILLTLRLGVGLVAVAAFACMVSQCVRIRATQSATGILYFGSIFAYVGELASQQITAQYGWPL